jgi:hypothetical protein
MLIQKLYIKPMRKTAKTAFFKVTIDLFLFTLEKRKYSMSNKKRTGRNHNQF